ncbi:hypothetical protein GCM10009069_04430 [Algimonas arctica]|uniref:PAS domain-containing protein n=1 Tax=Algimonas arctica TaxID=1479486 RepID=A0A8J3G170_9PROT|nr:LuxR C-terminal-related transcriptional regulator [Algimonas arctica]GHA84437.1 hypothetical protein GCM10009069_04430 [Algimonas arctica]
MGQIDDSIEENLTAMVAKTSVPFIITNPRLHDNPIVMCNAEFSELTGYSENSILGKNCRFLTGKDTEPEQTELIVNAIQNARPTLVQILNYKQDGSPFQNALMIAPWFDENGALAYFLGSQMEMAGTNNITSSRTLAVAEDRVKRLTPQQTRVLSHVAKGYRNKQIAHLLEISESTVKLHRASALTKLHVSTTAEAIRLAVEAGI